MYIFNYNYCMPPMMYGQIMPMFGGGCCTPYNCKDAFNFGLGMQTGSLVGGLAFGLIGRLLNRLG